ncbi:MAG: hypothetical protein IJG52_05070 [Lachnospiraceae bacterium]|nr:hypothetical protein [Lachnospiraceae bacterium]
MRTRNRKAILACMLCGVLAAGALAGCGSKEQTQEPAAEQEETAEEAAADTAAGDAAEETVETAAEPTADENSGDTVESPDAEAAAGAKTGQGGEKVLASDLFSITIPAGAASLCGVEETDNGFRIYSPAARAESGGDGGLVADIKAYVSVSEYAVDNFDWYGVLINDEGQKFNLAAVLPSDVQFGPGSKEEYMAISGALTQIKESVKPAESIEFIPAEDCDTVSIYDETLAKLRDALNNGEDPADFGMSSAYSYGGIDTVGYCYTDLDRDGYKELCIGPSDYPTDVEEPGNPVYDMYMQVDGEVYHIFSGWDNDFLTIPGEDLGAVVERASAGAESNVITFLNLSYEGKLLRGASLIYDGWEDPDNPYYIAYSQEEEPEKVSEEEWKQYLDNYGEMRNLEYQNLK